MFHVKQLKAPIYGPEGGWSQGATAVRHLFTHHLARARGPPRHGRFHVKHVERSRCWWIPGGRWVGVRRSAGRLRFVDRVRGETQGGNGNLPRLSVRSPSACGSGLAVDAGWSLSGCVLSPQVAGPVQEGRVAPIGRMVRGLAMPRCRRFHAAKHAGRGVRHPYESRRRRPETKPSLSRGTGPCRWRARAERVASTMAIRCVEWGYAERFLRVGVPRGDGLHHAGTTTGELARGSGDRPVNVSRETRATISTGPLWEIRAI